MRSAVFRFLAVLLIVFAALPLAACRTQPAIDAAVGWAAEPSLTGPAARVGFGTWEAGDPTSAGPAAPSAPDPALVKALADLDARQAKAAETLASLDAKVAAGALSASQAEEFRAAAARSEALATAAREAAAAAEAARIKAEEKTKNVGPPPSIPTDWTPQGIIAAVFGAGLWWVRRRAAKAAREEADRAKAEAKAATARAIEAFDNLPETASAADVRAAVALANAPPA